MAKSQSVRRLSSAGGSTGEGLRETLTSLIHEAHRQRASGQGILPASARVQPAQFYGGGSPMLPDSLQTLLRETAPNRRLNEIVLQRETREELREYLEEAGNTALLRSHSLEPRHTLLLVGPPGTGKTSLAGALATELALPFLTVRYEGLVGSYLGETAAHLQQVIDYVSRTPCVLFFDEFDSVGKERSDAQETGEIKRVVSSLLLQMDALPSHCIVVCATNHPELLDRAVWRRFEIRIELPKPGAAELREWFMRTQRTFGDLGMSATDFVRLFKDETFSEIEAITLDARRKVVLSHGKVTSAQAFDQAIARWLRRRDVNGATSLGQKSDRKNSARGAKTKASPRAKAVLPEEDLLGGAG